MPPQPSSPTAKPSIRPKACRKKNPSRNPSLQRHPAEKFPTFKNEKPKPITHPSKVIRTESSASAQRRGLRQGRLSRSSYRHAPTPGGGSGPVTVQGQGGGDFASRYGWYIEAVRRSVGQNWLQTTIDPAVRAARQAHCVMTFRINRDGCISQCPYGAIQRQSLDGQFGSPRIGRHSLRAAPE